MSHTDDALRLQHMLDHAREAVGFAAGKQESDLRQDRLLQLALVRLVEIIGEAAARITPETRAASPQIPWPQIVGMRNRLVHGYDSIDLRVLWDTIRDDLPPLIRELELIVPGSSPS